MTGILFLFHCKSNTGYAIASLESSFLAAAQSVIPLQQVFFAYPDISEGKSASLPRDFNNIIAFDPATTDKPALDHFEAFLKKHSITVIFGFDQPPSRPYYRAARRAGVRNIIAYWGAPLSSINTGLKLLLKKLEYKRHLNAPDLYLFESAAMARSATHGRGIPAHKTDTVYLGVDVDKFLPDANSNYAHRTFSISSDKKIIFYSGHMEPRKGVSVIMAAANLLTETRTVSDVHFLLLGNQPGEEQTYLESLSPQAKANVTFGGYRDDIASILPGCYAGCIASTGWDSFTMSSLEMAACGLPLLVSDLQGLVETVTHGTTGFHFKTGKHESLCEHLSQLLDDEAKRNTMALAARARVLEKFSKQHQINTFGAILRKALHPK